MGLLLLMAGCAMAATGAVVGPDQEEPREGPDHVAGRLIVKLTPDAAGRMVQAIRSDGFLSVDDVPIESLRRLSRKYRVVQWKPLLQSPAKQDLAGLGRVYLLSCDPAMDIEQAAAEFTALKDLVEYAQPDRIVRIQPVQ